MFKKKKKPKTRVAIILDRSGSMDSMRKEAVDAFNGQVETLRESSKGMDTKASLFTFATVADEPTIWNEDVAKLKPLTLDQYRPDGMTAMYDAIWMAAERLADLPEAEEKDTAFLVIVISDGEENNSKKTTGPLLAARLKALQETKRWTVTYLGANVDVNEMAKGLNIPRGNVAAFQATQNGMNTAARRTYVGTQSYMSSRAGGQSCTTSFYDSAQDDPANLNPTPEQVGNAFGSIIGTNSLQRGSVGLGLLAAQQLLKSSADTQPIERLDPDQSLTAQIAAELPSDISLFSSPIWPAPEAESYSNLTSGCDTTPSFDSSSSDSGSCCSTGSCDSSSSSD